MATTEGAQVFLVSPMKIPPSLCGIREIREIRGQKNQPRITQISPKNHNESHFHPQWRAAGSWKLGGEFAYAALATKRILAGGQEFSAQDYEYHSVKENVAPLSTAPSAHTWP